ncbi:MAG: hypothetical protein JWN74_2529 [Acidobacteriaceae bacterium]|nr:hypothetical protein [Acidobacteriaceae bacterium]
MLEQQAGDQGKKQLLWGLVLAWSTAIPVSIGLIRKASVTSANGLDGVLDSVVIPYMVFGLAVTLLSQVGAIVLLIRSFAGAYRVFSFLSICWSGLMLFLSSLCMWELLGQVIHR